MFYFLKRHLFPVAAHFDYSLVLTYACPRAVLEPLLAPGLTLDTQGELGFVAVAMVQTRRLRPAFFPSWLGLDFFLTGYRIFARYRDRRGRNLRGLRILRSDTDRPLMRVLGNLMTHYGYRDMRVETRRNAEEVSLRIDSREAPLSVRASFQDDPQLPSGSPFQDWREARKYAGPLPFTFDYEAQTHSIVIVEGQREHWDPKPLHVEQEEVGFLAGLSPRLASAFWVENIPYRWKTGVVERL